MRFIARLLRLFDAPYMDDSPLMICLMRTEPKEHNYECEDFIRDGYCYHWPSVEDYNWPSIKH